MYVPSPNVHSLNLRTRNMLLTLHGQGMKVADGMKVANLLALQLGD